jgi:hypothetical protein
MNGSDNLTSIPGGNRIGTAVAMQASMRIKIKSYRKWEEIFIPIGRDELLSAREDFKIWVAEKSTGPLDGSWGALMHWWMADRRPDWKKFGTIDCCYLIYAVGLSDERVRIEA